MEPENRFVSFTDKELDHIWQHLIAPFVDPAYEALVAELEAERTRRSAVEITDGSTP